MAADNNLDKYRIRVVDRTFDLLDALAASDVPLAASDLCKQSRLSKSTVHRLLMVMETRQMVEREGATHRYRLGSKIFELARCSEMNETRRRPQAFLDRLAQRTGGTARLAVLRDWEQIALLFTSEKLSGVSAAEAGSRMPIHCTALGKALVAFEPYFIGESLPYYRFASYTSRTITAPAMFRAELQRVKNSGFACDNEEYREGFRCIAAPVRDARGHVIAAVSVSGTIAEIRRDVRGEIVRALQSAAQQLAPMMQDLRPLHS